MLHFQKLLSNDINKRILTHIIHINVQITLTDKMQTFNKCKHKTIPGVINILRNIHRVRREV